MSAHALAAPMPVGAVRRRVLYPYLAIAPALILIAAVSFAPLGYALVQSVYKSRYLDLGQFVGFANYADFLFGNAALARIGNSLTFVFGTVAVATPLGVGFAMLLNQPIRFRGWFRTVLILPWLVSALVGGLLWAWLINPSFSPVIQDIERLFHLSIPSLLTSFTWSMPALILAHSWSSYPMIMVFTLAALQTVPNELNEAAVIDGAGPWQRFAHVTFPHIRSTLLVALVLTTLNTFNHVTMVLVMTGGGPVGSTETMALKVFLEAFKYYRMGTASAGAVVIFAVNVIFALIYARILRDEAA
ncbi:MAG TPA: sugar ABC transporter permease [Bauldia sp.]|nr:sugar ABC transporter permease [Bauldia sp.]